MSLSVFTFNSLEFAKGLEVAGVPREHAEAQAHALSKVFEANTRELATKDNMQTLEANLRAEITDLRKDMDVKFATVDARFSTIDARFVTVDAKLDKLLSQITARLGSMVLAAVMAMPFIFKLFHLL